MKQLPICIHHTGFANPVGKRLSQVLRTCDLAHWLLLLIFLLSSSSIHAQNYQEDMEKMQQAYTAMTNLHSKIAVNVFAKKGAAQPVFTQRLELWKKGEQMHYTVGELTMVTGKKYTLWINQGKREIAVQQNGKKKKVKGVAEMINPEMDEALKDYSKVTYLGKVKGLKAYRLSQEKGDIAQADIYLDSRGFLKRMEYLYRTNEDGSQNYIEVEFTVFNNTVNPSAQLFDERKYIIEKGGKLAPSPQYASYQLIMTKSEIDEK